MGFAMIKKLVRASIFLAATSWLAGCALDPQYTVAKNESDVRQGISVRTGYPRCPDCNKVKTYTSSALTGYSWSYNANGQLTGRVYVGITNNQPQNALVYFLKVEQTNSGIFTSGAGVYLVDDAGNKKLLNEFQMNNELRLSAYQMKGYGRDAQCQSNIGYSCWWTDYFMLTPAILDHAINSGHPLTLFIGQVLAVATTDGFNRTTGAVPIGGTVTISSAYLKTLRDELASRGIQLPSDAVRQ
ncbi:MAG: hypothetical protein FD173_224 [Gallionellaceae bacterium]|nr:MAG: hypothetical protein FD173_224 [Gallionellaceae bacterium]